MPTKLVIAATAILLTTPAFATPMSFTRHLDTSVAQTSSAPAMQIAAKKKAGSDKPRGANRGGKSDSGTGGGDGK